MLRELVQTSFNQSLYYITELESPSVRFLAAFFPHFLPLSRTSLYLASVMASSLSAFVFVLITSHSINSLSSVLSSTVVNLRRLLTNMSMQTATSVASRRFQEGPYANRGIMFWIDDREVVLESHQ